MTIRLLDPPLHEFLPHTEEDVAAVAAATGLDAAKLLRRAQELHEVNPMLGHRGCRLGVSYPEIYEMQVRAIIEAACEVAAAGRPAPIPEIMHPLVAKGEEMKFLRELTDRDRQAGDGREGPRRSNIMVGTMIELPRAAIRAGDLAENAEFFSFGTNDLTQTTFGISRDNSGRFLNAYIEKGIFEKDPFVSLDQEGVGDLIRIAAERGPRGAARRQARHLRRARRRPGLDRSSARASASTTSAARPTACRSPASPPPRPPSASARRTARERSFPREGRGTLISLGG